MPTYTNTNSGARGAGMGARAGTEAIRTATAMEKNRAKAIALGSFVVVLMLTVAITLTTLSLSDKNRMSDGVIPDTDTPVSAPIVFGLPVANYSSILKNCSLTSLQFNETMNRWESHKSVDLAAEAGTPVLATFAGTVTDVENNALYGRRVTIEHRDGLKTVYGNLDQNVNVAVGSRVEKGQRIGTVGQTSTVEFTTTPHLRVEVYLNNVRVDPNNYIDFTAK